MVRILLALSMLAVGVWSLPVDSTVETTAATTIYITLDTTVDSTDNSTLNYTENEIQVRLANDIPLPIEGYHVQVSQYKNGKYNLDIYQTKNNQRTKVHTEPWRVPENWKVLGRNASKVIHAELLSNGDVVIVLYSQANGLELIVVPAKIIQGEEESSTPYPFNAISFPFQPILFPDHTVPWHPTVSSRTTERSWEWTNTEETTTPNTHRSGVTPEKLVFEE